MDTRARPSRRYLRNIKNNQARLRLLKSDDFDLCNSWSFSAASPVGCAVRPHSISLTADGESPIDTPIAASVIPEVRNSEMRDAQVVMKSTVRDTVRVGQRHPITEFRCNVGMEDVPKFDTPGERIRYWRGQRGMTAKKLAEKAGIALSTLYGVENGDQKSSAALGLIADVLRLRPRYVTTGDGPIEVVVTPSEVKADDWPFSFDKKRLQSLSDTEFELLELTLLSKLEKLESRRPPRSKKA